MPPSKTTSSPQTLKKGQMAEELQIVPNRRDLVYKRQKSAVTKTKKIVVKTAT